jgi:succinylglutamic semialdehyde dehydrogenase
LTRLSSCSCARRLIVPGGRSAAFVTPAIVDVTGVDAPDEDFRSCAASDPRARFSGSNRRDHATGRRVVGDVISKCAPLSDEFLARSRAGVVNRNRATTGSAENILFGDLGSSDKHRASA